MQGSAGNGHDILVMFLTAMGMSASGVEFAGGIFLGLAGALAASRILATGMVRNGRSLGWWGTISVGLFVSVLAAQVAEIAVPDWPIQMPMAVGGFLSSFIAPIALKIAAGFSDRADKIAARALNRVLPDDD